MKKQRRPIQYRSERSPSHHSDPTKPVGVRPKQYRSERSPSRQSSVARSDISRSVVKFDSRSKTESRNCDVKHKSSRSLVKLKNKDSRIKSSNIESAPSCTRKKASRKIGKFDVNLTSNVKLESSSVEFSSNVTKSTHRCKRNESPEFDPIDSADGIRSIGGEVEEGEIVKSDPE